jgi:hypothetical protein
MVEIPGLAAKVSTVGEIAASVMDDRRRSAGQAEGVPSQDRPFGLI